MSDQETAQNILINKLNVSAEAFNDLKVLVNLLIKWNKTINLVGKSTIADVWQRHIIDSAQIWQHRPKTLNIWIDIGSGGGFPGLVLAILAKHQEPDAKFYLIESDVRKCAFLKNVSRETNLNTKIIADRIENIQDLQADVVSARALASVDVLCELSHKFLTDNAFCLFLKGKGCDKEVEKALVSWRFQSLKTKSISDDTGVILKVWNLERA
jgi:16S rRNA (guanine527-N7)-methyltransferase